MSAVDQAMNAGLMPHGPRAVNIPLGDGDVAKTNYALWSAALFALALSSTGAFAVWFEAQRLDRVAARGEAASAQVAAQGAALDKALADAAAHAADPTPQRVERLEASVAALGDKLDGAIGDELSHRAATDERLGRDERDLSELKLRLGAAAVDETSFRLKMDQTFAAVEERLRRTTQSATANSWAIAATAARAARKPSRAGRRY